MSLEFKKDEGVALIGLNRPEAKNALDATTLRELALAWKEVAEDDSIRAAVLTGSPMTEYSTRRPRPTTASTTDPQ